VQKKIFDHYKGIVDAAEEVAKSANETRVVGLCRFTPGSPRLHPGFTPASPHLDPILTPF